MALPSTKLLDDRTKFPLSPGDRNRIGTVIFNAESKFYKLARASGIELDRDRDLLKCYVEPMQETFDGIAGVLYDADALSIDILRKELRLYVIELAIARGWLTCIASREQVTEILPGYVGHKTVWDNLEDWHPGIFAAEEAAWIAKLLKRGIAPSTASSPAVVEQQPSTPVADEPPSESVAEQSPSATLAEQQRSTPAMKPKSRARVTTKKTQTQASKKKTRTKVGKAKPKASSRATDPPSAEVSPGEKRGRRRFKLVLKVIRELKTLRPQMDDPTEDYEKLERRYRDFLVFKICRNYPKAKLWVETIQEARGIHKLAFALVALLEDKKPGTIERNWKEFKPKTGLRRNSKIAQT
jgi:hypothetical protein